jgi:hypothetical protein
MNIVQALNKVKNDLLVFITTNLNNKSDVGHTHDEYASSSHDHVLATTSTSGFMDASDKVILDNLSTLVGDSSVSEQINNAVGQINIPTLTEHLTEEEMILSSLQYGDEFPSVGTQGKIFFKKAGTS